MLLMIVFVLAFADGADVCVAVATGEVGTVGSGRGRYSEYCAVAVVAVALRAVVIGAIAVSSLDPFWRWRG